MYRVLVCDPIAREAIDLLRKNNFKVDFVESPAPEELCRIIAAYDVIIVRSATKVTKEVIDRGEKLKIIARAGAGLDNIDVEHANKRKIKVINAPEALAVAVAEHTIALMLMLLRKEYHACRSLKEEKLWLKKKFLGEEAFGKTIGIIGLGRIGSEVAKRCKALGMRVLGYRRHKLEEKARELGIVAAPSLDFLLSESDIISIHVPLNKETFHMIGERELNLMRPNVYLINTSRGAVIDGKSLLRALENNRIAGVALDVFENEPPREPWEWKLITHPRVIVTPHIGAMTKESQRKTGLIIAQKIITTLSTDQ